MPIRREMDLQYVIDIYGLYITHMLNRGEYPSDLYDWIANLAVDIHKKFGAKYFELPEGFELTIFDRRISPKDLNNGFKHLISLLDNVELTAIAKDNVSKPLPLAAFKYEGHNKLDVKDSKIIHTLLYE